MQGISKFKLNLAHLDFNDDSILISILSFYLIFTMCKFFWRRKKITEEHQEEKYSIFCVNFRFTLNYNSLLFHHKFALKRRFYVLLCFNLSIIFCSFQFSSYFSLTHSLLRLRAHNYANALGKYISLSPLLRLLLSFYFYLLFQSCCFNFYSISSPFLVRFFIIFTAT